MEQNVIQINGGTTINVDASVKNIIYVKKNMFGILVHVFWKWEIFSNIIDDSVITCDEVMESYHEEIRTIPTNSNEKEYNLQNTKFLYFTYLFINHHYIIDSC